MTTFSTQQGTPSTLGFFARRKRARQGLDNQDLIQAIASDYPAEVARLLTRPDRNLEEPYQIFKNVNNGYEVWRTPLEHAVDVGHSSAVVDQLLTAGAKVTSHVLELALDNVCGDWASGRDPAVFVCANKIVDRLTASGVQWDAAVKDYGLSGKFRSGQRFNDLAFRLLPQDEATSVEVAPAGWSVPPAPRRRSPR